MTIAAAIERDLTNNLQFDIVPKHVDGEEYGKLHPAAGASRYNRGWQPAMSYWDDLSHHTELDGNWMHHPAVRERINLRVSGDRFTWPTTWLKQRLGSRAPLARTVSIGCGVGTFERDVVRQEIVSFITGVDASVRCIARAEEVATDEGYSGRIAYHCGDAREWLRSARDLDAVFFHQSLHHFDRLDELMQLVKESLKPDGVLYVDEYIGPSRDEWRVSDLVRLNRIYYRLPREVRRVRLIRAPVNHEDPTEAIQSSKIMEAISRQFEILERRDYGGNLLSVIYPNLNWMARSETHDAKMLEAVELLLDAENTEGSRSYYTVALATPKR